MCNYAKIIDVSEFNGAINWQTVKNNADGVILRAGYRGYGAVGTLVRDKRLAENLAGVRKYQIPYGIYWLSQATTETEAKVEAEFVNGALGGQIAPLGVWLDSEYGDTQYMRGRADTILPGQRTVCARAFLNAMKKYKQTTGLYCAASWYRTMLFGDDIRKDGNLIWIASVENVAPSVAWDMWQYTWRGKIPGINGDVDISHRKEGLALAKTFKDIENHWAKDYINRAKAEGIMNGKTDELFDPDTPITRAEAAVVAVRLLDKFENGKA